MGASDCKCDCPEECYQDDPWKQSYQAATTSYIRRNDGSDCTHGVRQGFGDASYFQHSDGGNLQNSTWPSPSPGSETNSSFRGWKAPSHQQMLPATSTPRRDASHGSAGVPSTFLSSPRAANLQAARSVEDWAQDQEQFAHLPKLPDGWMRVVSRTTGAIYYCYTETGETTLNEPTGPPPSKCIENGLPPGWIERVSRTTGRAYYWNYQLQKSQYTRPTANISSASSSSLPPRSLSAERQSPNTLSQDPSLESSPTAAVQSMPVRLDEEDSEKEATEAAKAGSDLKMDYEMIGVHQPAASVETTSKQPKHPKPPGRWTEPSKPQWMQQVAESVTSENSK